MNIYFCWMLFMAGLTAWDRNVKMIEINTSASPFVSAVHSSAPTIPIYFTFHHKIHIYNLWKVMVQFHLSSLLYFFIYVAWVKVLLWSIHTCHTTTGENIH